MALDKSICKWHLLLLLLPQILAWLHLWENLVEQLLESYVLLLNLYCSLFLCHCSLYSLLPSILSLLGYELTGLARGGEQVSRLKRNYAKAVELLVELASLQVSLARLVNHAEHV